MKEKIAVVVGGTLYIGWIEIKGDDKEIYINGEAARSGEAKALEEAAWLNLNSAKWEKR